MVALSAGRSGLAAAGPLTAEQEATLAAARAYALEYSKQLPDFMCTQITHRQILPVNMPLAGTTSAMNNVTPSGSEDRTRTIEEKLTYFNEEEHYDVVAVNGLKATGGQHMDVAGAVSAGEFGSALRELFDPESHAVFKWDRAAGLRGRHAQVFAYEVPEAAGARIYDRALGKEIVAAYRGSVWVDADSKEVLRITSHLDLPADFPIALAERIVDYRHTSIAGQSYNLPFHAELKMNVGNWSYLNEIEFKAYQKFAVESTIRFGDLANQPLAEAPPDQSALEANPGSTASPHLGVSDAPQAASAPVPVASAKTEAGEEAKPLSEAAMAPATVAPPLAQSTLPGPANAENSVFQLQLRVDLVVVPAVVRDAVGHAVGNLKQEDFELFDKGKRQNITSFTVQHEADSTASQESGRNVEGHARPGESRWSAETHSVVYVFDDVHLKAGDLMRVQEAASRHIDALPPNEKAAIVSTSGLVVVQFTGDRAKLREALPRLHAHPLGGSAAEACPEISDYQAHQMLEVYPPDGSNNPPLQAATDETIACMQLPPQMAVQARNIALAAARRVQSASQQEGRSTMMVMRDVIRGLAQVPGTKTIVLVSPGFVVAGGLGVDETGVVDDAIRAQVTINALDARGLYVDSMVSDIDKNYVNAQALQIKTSIAREEAMVAAGLLTDFAEGTGGSVVRNTNDLAGGLEQLAKPPEFVYLLGFKPSELGAPLSFHTLKVKLKSGRGLSVQARHGYVTAPK
jgi:VWFA-related protein